jgi:hypothetical protein
MYSEDDAARVCHYSYEDRCGYCRCNTGSEHDSGPRHRTSNLTKGTAGPFWTARTTLITQTQLTMRRSGL